VASPTRPHQPSPFRKSPGAARQAHPPPEPAGCTGYRAASPLGSQMARTAAAQVERGPGGRPFCIDAPEELWRIGGSVCANWGESGSGLPGSRRGVLSQHGGSPTPPAPGANGALIAKPRGKQDARFGAACSCPGSSAAAGSDGLTLPIKFAPEPRRADPAGSLGRGVSMLAKRIGRRAPRNSMTSPRDMGGAPCRRARRLMPPGADSTGKRKALAVPSSRNAATRASGHRSGSYAGPLGGDRNNTERRRAAF